MTREGYSIGRDESGLTRRERQVAELLRGGKSQNAISNELGISRQRVSELVKTLEAKGVHPTGDPEHRRGQAAQADREAGITEDPL